MRLSIISLLLFISVPFLTLANDFSLKESISVSITLEEHIFEIDGRKRVYYLYMPKKLVVNAPLIFTLHGYGGNAKSMIEYAKMNEVAEKNGFAVCYPQGNKGEDGKNSWNAGYSNDDVDDVKFLTALAKFLQKEFLLSTKNTFCTGMSNGADMSYVLACQRPEVFAAVAPVAGCMMQTTFDACTNLKSVPIFEIHGTDDEITLWDGDPNYSKKYGSYLGTRAIIDFWVDKNTTSTVSYDTLFDFNETDGSYVVSEKHTGGVNNQQVWLYKLVNGKHDWPGTWGNRDFQTSEVVWNFFQQFLREEGSEFVTVEKHFTKSTPEAEGMASSGILSFIKRAETEVDALHSFMIIRHGKIVSEGWWDPYDRNTAHVMHSLSKSFTSTAIGMLINEGKLALTDKVLSFFPEYAPEKPSWQMSAMTIRDLITMNTGHIKEPMVWSSDGDWVKYFLESEVELGPGTHFKYNSAATYMLSAILQKVTGEKLVDFLDPRLFKPLKIKKPDWDTCPKGINTGGWGLHITTEDIAKLGQFYLQKGNWNGQQIISKKWVAMASAKQVSNGSDPNNDWNQGYGFQFWRCRHNCYRGDGAMGQFCIVVPEKDAVIAITAGANDMGAIMNLVWEELLPSMQSSPLPENPKKVGALNKKTANLMLPTINGNNKSSLSKKIGKKAYNLPENKQGIKSIRFKLNDKKPTIEIEMQHGKEVINVGTDHYKKSTLKHQLPYTNNLMKKIAANGKWTKENEFQLRVYLYEMPARITYTFKFEADQLIWDSHLQHSLFGPRTQEQLIGIK